MTYPILVSPRHTPEVIVEFTSQRTGRIILAHPKAYINDYAGYMSPVGTIHTDWAECDDEDLSSKYGNWVSITNRHILKTVPYIVYNYPEEFI